MVSVRCPRATGLTSYPSGYLIIAVGWIGFSIRPNQEVLRTLPHSPTPRTRLPLSRSASQQEPFGEVVSPDLRVRAGSQ
jgi:hypothetical protein